MSPIHHKVLYTCPVYCTDFMLDGDAP